jgi:hypothetical protein
MGGGRAIDDANLGRSDDKEGDKEEARKAEEARRKNEGFFAWLWRIISEFFRRLARGGKSPGEDRREENKERRKEAQEEQRERRNKGD